MISTVVIILTGANNDGSQGMKKIKQHGGYTIVQGPSEAKVPAMPEAAIASTEIDQILTLEEIGKFLGKICEQPDKNSATSSIKEQKIPEKSQ